MKLFIKFSLKTFLQNISHFLFFKLLNPDRLTFANLNQYNKNSEIHGIEIMGDDPRVKHFDDYHV